MFCELHCILGIVPSLYMYPMPNPNRTCKILFYGTSNQDLKLRSPSRASDLSPHAAEVPSTYGGVVRGGQLSAVVVWTPLARGELQLPFAFQRGTPGDLQRANQSTHIPNR